jgi:hypothetical protein
MSFTPETMAGFTVIMGVGFLASIGANIVSMVKVFRRNPPIDQTLTEYAKSSDLKSVAAKAEADLKAVEISAGIAYARRSEFEHFRAEMQQSCAANHARVDKTLGELFEIQRNMIKEFTDRLDRNHAALTEWQRGIERQIGRLEADKSKGGNPV